MRLEQMGALGGGLTAISQSQWDSSSISKFEKNFYQEHPAVSAMTSAEVDAFRASKQVERAANLRNRIMHGSQHRSILLVSVESHSLQRRVLSSSLCATSRNPIRRGTRARARTHARTHARTQASKEAILRCPLLPSIRQTPAGATDNTPPRLKHERHAHSHARTHERTRTQARTRASTHTP